MGTVTRGPMLIRLGLLAALAAVVVVVAVLLAGGDSSDGDKGGGTPAATTSTLRGVPQSGIALGSPDAPVTMSSSPTSNAPSARSIRRTCSRSC